MIYPEGTGRAGTWNGGYCCGSAQRQGVDDLAFLRRRGADAARRFGLDGGRVNATGMSNGSIMAETLGGPPPPGRLRAVAGVAGTMDTAARASPLPSRLLHIHGTQDDMVPYGGGRAAALTRTQFALRRGLSRRPSSPPIPCSRGPSGMSTVWPMTPA